MCSLSSVYAVFIFEQIDCREDISVNGINFTVGSFADVLLKLVIGLLISLWI